MIVEAVVAVIVVVVVVLVVAVVKMVILSVTCNGKTVLSINFIHQFPETGRENGRYVKIIV